MTTPPAESVQVPDFTEPVIAARIWNIKSVTSTGPKNRVHVNVGGPTFDQNQKISDLTNEARKIIQAAQLALRGLTEEERAKVESLIDSIKYLKRDDPAALLTKVETFLVSPYQSNHKWEPGKVFEAICNQTPSPDPILNWKAEILNDATDINAWQTKYPVRRVVTEKRLHLEMDLRLPGLEEALQKGITFRFDKNGEMHVDALELPILIPPPHPEHKCGAYAMSRIDEIVWADVRMHGDGKVIGLVELTGRIIPATKGWRAQYAKPVALISYNRFDGVLDALSKRYDVPLITEKEAVKRLSKPEDYRRKDERER